MSSWTHNICDTCFKTRQNDEHVRASRLPDQELVEKIPCCFCNELTNSGIFIRQNPALSGCTHS